MAEKLTRAELEKRRASGAKVAHLDPNADNAITKLGPGRRFQFKYDYCKGCGMCASECPCGAIRMVPEEI